MPCASLIWQEGEGRSNPTSLSCSFKLSPTDIGIEYGNTLIMEGASLLKLSHLD